MQYHSGSLNNYAVTTDVATLLAGTQLTRRAGRARLVIRAADNSAMPLERMRAFFWPNEPNAGMPAILAKRTQRRDARHFGQTNPRLGRRPFWPNEPIAGAPSFLAERTQRGTGTI
jgi:hypothetical protein